MEIWGPKRSEIVREAERTEGMMIKSKYQGVLQDILIMNNQDLWNTSRRLEKGLPIDFCVVYMDCAMRWRLRQLFACGHAV